MTNNYNDRLKQFVESESDQDQICIQYVLIAVTENFLTNEQKFFVLVPPEQPTCATIGLLESASAGEKLRMARQLLGDE
jgi:hypothetical protein